MSILAESAAPHWATVGAFIATAIAALVAITATCINYYIFRSHVDPHVIIYADPDRTQPSLICLIIENVGRGLAKDVKFTFSRPLPQRAFGFEDAPVPKPMEDGPLITGIPSLGPGGRREIAWGQFGGIHKGIGDDVVMVTVHFKSDAIGPFEAKKHNVECPIDIKSLHKTAQPRRPSTVEIAEHLKSIDRTLKQLLEQ